MKRSLSRASKTAAEVQQDAKENLIPGISEGKWKEILDKEKNDLFILGIREEIVQNCMKICYENYLKRQAVSFTIHCAHLAWVKVIGVYYMFKDPGDEEDPEVRQSWEPDEEPEPSVIDSWGSQCIRAVVPEPLVKEKEEAEVDVGTLQAEETSRTSYLTGSDLPGEGEASYYYPDFSESDTYLPAREKSIFSKTLSMSKESLILLEPLGLLDCRTIGLPANQEKNPKKTIKKSN